MRKWIAIAVIAFLSAFVGSWAGKVAYAQSSAVLQLTGVWSTHTACSLPVSGQTSFCMASDGLWESLNGAAYVQLGNATVVTGVTSFNGRTGAVVPVTSDYPPIITSVNGKTGAVVLNIQ